MTDNKQPSNELLKTIQDAHRLQAQAFDKLTLEERLAIDEMWLGNFKGALHLLFNDLKDGVPTGFIEPTPIPELNKYIQEQVKLFRNE